MYVEQGQLKKFILDSGLVSKVDIDTAEKEAREKKINLGQVLVTEGKVHDDDLRRMQAYVLGIPFVELKSKSGFTLVEMLVAVAISVVIIIAMTSFQRDIFYQNSIQSGSFSTAQDARIIIRTMLSELRSASPGSDGSYPIVQAATSTLIFFSDINGDGNKERIRYFLATTTLEKGVVTPTGSPLSYNLSNEKISILAVNVRNISSTSITLFNYFDGSYSGTSSPLTQPVTTSAVRLVQINLTLDQDPNRSPLPRTYTSDVTLRNLKDNL